MPVKPETILRRVRLLPEYQSKLYLEFKDWLQNEQDNSERNWLNYFKVLVLFSDHICSKELKDVTKDDVVTFLKKKKKISHIQKLILDKMDDLKHNQEKPQKDLKELIDKLKDKKK